jgi:hypothetical protein
MSLAAAHGAEPGNVTAIDVDDIKYKGELQAFSDERLTIAGREPYRLSTEELLRLQFTGRTARPVGDRSLVVLANGDRLVAHTIGMDEESLVAELIDFPTWPAVHLPLETVRGIVVTVPRSSSVRSRLFAQLFSRRQATDVVILDNGDQVTGELLAIDPSTVALEGGLGSTRIEQKEVRAVAFSSELISFPKVTGRRELLTLTDGSRITVRNVQLSSNGFVRVDALFGARLNVPTDSIVSLRFLGGRAVYLFEVEPAEYHFTPYVAAQWPLTINRSVAGGPLLLRGTEYAHGIGMHSKSTVTFPLDGSYRDFRAIIGIDDSTGGRGSVVFGVTLDDESVFTSVLLTGDSAALAIPPIDVRGKQKLTLRVDFGHLGDIQDHANWCDALLVK